MKRIKYSLIAVILVVFFVVISLQKNLPEPLYIVDGKEMTISEFDRLGLKIKKLDKYVGDKAVATFGEKGKNGVMVISTK